jgi:hypothetical protein
MEPRHLIAKSLMIFGAVLFVIGLIIFVIPKIPWVGRLPGDIHFRGKNYRIDFPIVTSIIISILLSILLTIILNIIAFFRK